MGVVFVRVRRVNQPSGKKGPVGVVFVRVSGVKAHSRKKQPSGCQGSYGFWNPGIILEFHLAFSRAWKSYEIFYCDKRFWKSFGFLKSVVSMRLRFLIISQFGSAYFVVSTVK